MTIIIHNHQKVIFCSLSAYHMLVNHSHIFAKRLRILITNKFNVHLNIYYKTTRVNTYFQLKCATPNELSANVVYKFTCQCDTTLSYAGYIARHLITRAREHLNFNFIVKSAIKDHVYSCFDCFEKHFSVCDCTVLKKCHAEYEAKIQEALLIRKQTPLINRQLYTSAKRLLTCDGLRLFVFFNICTYFIFLTMLNNFVFWL